jgi:hypothetical protein
LVENSVHEKATHETLVAQDYEEYDPGIHYEGRFSCLMKCSHCQESVAVAGVSFNEFSHMSGQEPLFALALSPRYFSPSPDLFRLPAKCPEEIVQQVRSAFSLYWCDKHSCLNRLRGVVELILTEMEIDRLTEKDGRRTVIPLHSRI